jgi:hypothetical protein
MRTPLVFVRVGPIDRQVNFSVLEGDLTYLCCLTFLLILDSWLCGSAITKAWTWLLLVVVLVLG